MGEAGIVVRRAVPEEIPACQSVRRAVFIQGMGVPASIEVDGRDGACVHVIALDAGVPAGTARLRDHRGRAKVERVAVLDAYQGLGLGVRLMREIESIALQDGYGAVELHAQVQVVGFYEKLGYEAVGPRFQEADIWHQSMRLPLVM